MRKRITVVGDLMIDVDHLVESSTNKEDRACLKIRQSQRRLGAAGAVARMISSLCVDVTLVTVAALDDALWIRRQMTGNSFVLGSRSLTTRRERFHHDDWSIAGPRLDFNPAEPIDVRDQMILASKVVGSAPDAVIVCDHARGIVGQTLMDQLRALGKPIYVDPHVNSDWKAFHSIEALVMNREEALAAVEAQPFPKNIIEKLDADGLFWYGDGWRMENVSRGEEPKLRQYFPSMARQIVDTLGAGDQFIAALTCAQVMGATMQEAIAKASAAAGIQCERRGIVPVTWREIDERLKPNSEG